MDIQTGVVTILRWLVGEYTYTYGYKGWSIRYTCIYSGPYEHRVASQGVYIYTSLLGWSISGVGCIYVVQSLLNQWIQAGVNKNTYIRRVYKGLVNFLVNKHMFTLKRHLSYRMHRYKVTYMKTVMKNGHSPEAGVIWGDIHKSLSRGNFSQWTISGQGKPQRFILASHLDLTASQRERHGQIALSRHTGEKREHRKSLVFGWHWMPSRGVQDAACCVTSARVSCSKRFGSLMDL